MNDPDYNAKFDAWYKSITKAERKAFDKSVQNLTDLCDEQMDGDEIIGFRD